MTADQLFVGAVAFILGLLALIAAIHNRDWYFRLPKARWIEERWGRNAVRVVYGLLGIALIALGVVIVLGDRQNEEMNQRRRHPSVEGIGCAAAACWSPSLSRPFPPEGGTPPDISNPRRYSFADRTDWHSVPVRLPI